MHFLHFNRSFKIKWRINNRLSVNNDHVPSAALFSKYMGKNKLIKYQIDFNIFVSYRNSHSIYVRKNALVFKLFFFSWVEMTL